MKTKNNVIESVAMRRVSFKSGASAESLLWGKVHSLFHMFLAANAEEIFRANSLSLLCLFSSPAHTHLCSGLNPVAWESNNSLATRNNRFSVGLER